MVKAQRVIAATTVLSSLIAVGICLLVGWHGTAWWAIAGLAVGAVISELTSVNIIIGRQGFSFALIEAFIAVALVREPGAWIPVAVAVGVAVAYLLRRMQWFKTAFNVAQYSLAVTAAVAVTQSLGGGLMAAAAGLVTFAVLNHLLVSIAVAAASGQPWHRVIGLTGGLGVIHNAGNISVGLLAAWLSLNAPLGLIGLLVPVILLWFSYREQADRTAEARLFEELAHGQEQLAKTSVDTSTRVVVGAAARLFGGAEVEMLLRHPDGPVRYYGNEHGVQSRVRVDSDAFDAPWVLRVLAQREIVTGVDGDVPFCSMALGDHERPLAMLIVRRQPRANRFRRSDERLAKILVTQAESWLSMADLSARHDFVVGQVEAYGAASRVIGDVSATTAPALAVLRESADRLSRLTYNLDGPDPLSDIVEELHSVERAVASLLGAIALASDAPLAMGTVKHTDHQVSVGRAEAEWTTTGQLDVGVEASELGSARRP